MFSSRSFSSSIASSSSADEYDLLLLSNSSDDELRIEIELESPRQQDNAYSSRYHSRQYCTQTPFARKLEDCIDILERQLSQIDRQLAHQASLESSSWTAFLVTILSLTAMPILTYMAFDMIFLPHLRLQYDPAASQGDRLVPEIMQYPEFANIFACRQAQEAYVHDYQVTECLSNLFMYKNYSPELKVLLDKLAPIFPNWKLYADSYHEIDHYDRWLATMGTLFLSLLLTYGLTRVAKRDAVQNTSNRHIESIQPNSHWVSPEDSQKLIHVITLLDIPVEQISKRDLLDIFKKIKAKAVNQFFLFFAANQNDVLRLPNDIHKIIYSDLVEKITEDKFHPLQNLHQ